MQEANPDTTQTKGAPCRLAVMLALLVPACTELASNATAQP